MTQQSSSTPRFANSARPWYDSASIFWGILGFPSTLEGLLFNDYGLFLAAIGLCLAAVFLHDRHKTEAKRAEESSSPAR